MTMERQGINYQQAAHRYRELQKAKQELGRLTKDDPMYTLRRAVVLALEVLVRDANKSA